MLDRFKWKNQDELRNALKQIVQQITLVALGRTDFFSKAAFYGGTALRIFYDLHRFSEDLDFSLLAPDSHFTLDKYIPVVKDELAAFGFDMDVQEINKSADSNIKSAFIKGNTLMHMVKIASIEPPVSGIPVNERLKIKMELDIHPPEGAGFDMKYLLLPIPAQIRTYDLPSLFAGKVHALLCRSWKNRVKGRDFYDYQWYLAHGTSLNLEHLEARMCQSGHYTEKEKLTLSKLHNMLNERFQSVDFEQVKQDVMPFVKDPRGLDLWSASFFEAITGDWFQGTQGGLQVK